MQHPVRTLVVVTLVLAGASLPACGDEGASNASPPTPPGPVTSRPSDPAGSSGGDAGAVNDDASPPAPPSSCARDVVAKTAPASLFDAFQSEIGALDAAAKSARVDKLLADVAKAGGTPLEDPTTGRVVFLARGAPPSGAATWKASGSFSTWATDGGITLDAIAGTDLWAGVTTMSSSFEYKLLDGGTFVEDRLAQNVDWDGIDRGFGVRGEFNAVGRPGIAPADQGRTIALGNVHAQKLADDREVWIHFPASYDAATCKDLPSIVFHDGLESLTRGGFAKKADELYAARPELSAVLVFVGLPSPDVRMAEYTIVSDGAKGDDYVDFLLSDLWPVVTKRARVCSKPAARGMSGASLGGLISTYAVFGHPDQLGWIGAQSASYFWDDNVMIDRVSAAPKEPLRIYLDSGCPDDNCDVTDQLAGVLETKGYDYVRIKQDGAQHDWPYWRDRLQGLLTHFRDGQTVCD